MLEVLHVLVACHIKERPVRTLITVLGVALGTCVAIAIRTANVEVLKSFEESVTAVAGRATLQISGGDLGLDERVIADIRRHPAVLSASPVLHEAARIAAGPHQGKSFVIMGLDLLEAGDLRDFRVRDHDATQSLDRLLSREALFVGARLASDWGLQTGRPLDLLVGTQVYRVMIQGRVESGGRLPSVWDRMAVMDIAAAQALFGLVGRLDRIDLVTAPGSTVAKVAEDLRRMLPPMVTVSRPSQRNEQIERMLSAFQLNLATLSAVGLMVGFFLVYNTVSFAVVQRRREIGILRALGLSRRGITVLFLSEAAVMGLVGGVLGSALGVLLARSVVRLMSRTVADLYLPVSVGPGDLLDVPSGLWLTGGGLGLAVAMLGAIAPSIGASRTAAARALAPGEYEATQTVRTGVLAWIGCGGLALAAALAIKGPVRGLPLFGYASAFCLLLGLSFLAPMLVRATRTFAGICWGSARWAGRVTALGRIAAEQVARAPGRNAVTIGALVVGIAIMVGVGIMIQSFRHTVDLWINQTIIADLIIAPTSWLQGEEAGMLTNRLPRAWAERVASLPGVEAVDTYRDVIIAISGRPVALVSRDLRLHAERSRYLLVEGDSRVVLPRTVAANGVVVSEVLASALGVRVGDKLPLITPTGVRRFAVMGVFYDYATDGGKVVMDRELYTRIWQDESVTVIPVYTTPGVDAGAVRRRIEDTLGQEGHLVVIGNAELKQEILAIFDRTFTITYALELIAVVVALLGIVNTLLTAVLERQRELATLRAIGASARQICGLILWESAYLGLLGSALGLVGGILLSILLVDVINKQSFGWTIQFVLPGRLLVEAVGLAVAAALVAGYLPARWAAKQSVVDGLRYE
jgi:putative ABC transport system permease protein